MLWSILTCKAAIFVEGCIFWEFGRRLVRTLWGKYVRPRIDKAKDKAEKVIGDNFGARL